MTNFHQMASDCLDIIEKEIEQKRLDKKTSVTPITCLPEGVADSFVFVEKTIGSMEYNWTTYYGIRNIYLSQDSHYLYACIDTISETYQLSEYSSPDDLFMDLMRLLYYAPAYRQEKIENMMAIIKDFKVKSKSQITYFTTLVEHFVVSNPSMSSKEAYEKAEDLIRTFAIKLLPSLL